MLASVLITFEEKEEFFIRGVLREIKRTDTFKVRRITIGRLFEKKAASIFLPQDQLQNMFDKLIANEINIFPFNEEYKEKIKETKERIRKSHVYEHDKLRAEYYRAKRASGISFVSAEENYSRKINPIAAKTAKPLPIETQNTIKNFDVNKSSKEPLDVYVKEGNYQVIRNMIKNNPLHNEQIKEKYIPAIKSSVQIQLEKGLNEPGYLDQAIEKLTGIICDEEIRAIKTDDFVGLAGDALIKICVEKKREELVSLSNLPSIGQRLNVMAAVKLAELIFEEKETTDDALLKFATEKINRRFLLTSFDVIEPSISELNKSRFNLLMNSIQEMAA